MRLYRVKVETANRACVGLVSKYQRFGGPSFWLGLVRFGQLPLEPIFRLTLRLPQSWKGPKCPNLRFPYQPPGLPAVVSCRAVPMLNG